MPDQTVGQTIGSLLWAAFVLVSWAGFGGATARWTGTTTKAGFGLRAAWGMAVVVLVGGVFNAFQICSPATLGGLTLVGAGLAAWEAIRRARAGGWRPKFSAAAAVPVLLIVAYGALVVVASSALHGLTLNAIDDDTLYCLLPKKMLQAGAAFEPLSQRRLTTFGGYAFLQAQVDVVARGLHPFLLDRGVAGVVFVLLLIGGKAKTVFGRWADLLVAAACWLYPIPSANVMAAWTAAVTVLALLHTMLLADDSADRVRLRLMALAALLVAAGGTFRVNALPVAPLFFAVYYATRIWRTPAAWRAAAKEIGVLAGVGVAAVAPWSVALHAACGSYLYPLMRGNERPDMHLGAAFDTAMRVHKIFETLSATPFTLLVPAGVLLFVLRRWTAAWLFAAAFVTAGVTAYAYPVAVTADYERYGVPLVIGPALFAVDRALRLPQLRRRPGLVVVVAAYLGAIVSFTDRTPAESLAKQWREAKIALSPDAPPFYTPRLRRAYAELQQAVPPGKTIAAMLDYPVLFDLGRNPVDTFDLPARAEKRGTWPVGLGPEKLRAFLAEQDVDYVAWEDFTRADRMYSFKSWDQQGQQGNGNAITVVRLMGDLEGLRHTPAMVYDHDGLYLARVR